MYICANTYIHTCTHEVVCNCIIISIGISIVPIVISIVIFCTAIFTIIVKAVEA